MGAVETETGRRGQLRPFHRGSLSPRHEPHSLASRQSAAPMPHGPGGAAHKGFAEHRIAAVKLDNAAIAELLALEAERAEGILVKAFKRASRAAFLWPLEASEVLARGSSLTELPGIGSYLERL